MLNELIGKEIAGKYRIESMIRETELGDFYHGTNTVTGSPVTIKILAPAMAIDQRYIDRFLADARAGASVSHLNILNNIDIGADPAGAPYAVYEGADGESLRNLLRSEGALPAPRAVAIAKQIASALAAAHRSGLVHAGLNPEKIFVADLETGESVKIFDFGRRLHSKNSMSAVGYLAPEQCTSSPTSDERSDIYSLGIILYEMLAGEHPHAGPTPAEIISKQTNEPPPPLSAYRQDLPAQIEPMILSAIAVDPERRYQLMSDFDEDLGRIGSEIGANIPATAVVAAVSAQTPNRNIWQTAFIVFAGIALVAAALIYGTSVKQTNPTASLAPDANSLPVQPINPATGAQEDALAKLGDIGDASLVPGGSIELPGTIPGGDGFNAWANGGVPPAGAPIQGPTMNGPQPPQYMPPGGQTVTIDPNGGSQFMPNEGGVILVPIPANNEPAAKPTPTPKGQAANTAPKPLATPPPKGTPAANTAGTKTATPATPAQTPAKKPTAKPKTDED